MTLAQLEYSADRLHKTFCASNHTDECSWYYDSWDRLQDSKVRLRYLRCANALAESGLTPDDVDKFCDSFSLR